MSLTINTCLTVFHITAHPQPRPLLLTLPTLKHCRCHKKGQCTCCENCGEQTKGEIEGFLTNTLLQRLEENRMWIQSKCYLLLWMNLSSKGFCNWRRRPKTSWDKDQLLKAIQPLRLRKTNNNYRSCGEGKNNPLSATSSRNLGSAAKRCAVASARTRKWAGPQGYSSTGMTMTHTNEWAIATGFFEGASEVLVLFC